MGTLFYSTLNFRLNKAISIALVAVCLSAYTAEGKARRIPAFQKGMCYPTWDKNSFLLPSSDKSLELLAASGANCVSIIPTWYQKKADSLQMKPGYRTPSDESVVHAIRQAHKCSMAVMLKPHIDLETSEDGAWRGDIGFYSAEKWKAWFDNYAKFITHYAVIAEKEGVEFFSVGTELIFASAETEMWRDYIIPEVRKVFSGKITYAANWDNYNFVGFWDSVDYAGIDAFFPLHNKYDPPPYEKIKKSWQKWVFDIEKWQKKIQKPVIFTECGYRSIDSAAMQPWEWQSSAGNTNLSLQADCYRAVFETFWDKQWFSGMHWWGWSTNPKGGGPNNRDYTILGKPALEELRKWYAKGKGEMEITLPSPEIKPSILEGVSPLEFHLKTGSGIVSQSYIAPEAYGENASNRYPNSNDKIQSTK